MIMIVSLIYDCFPDLWLFPQVCLACRVRDLLSITHAAPYPGHKIYTLACDHKYWYCFSCAIKTLVTSLTYWRLMMCDQPPLVIRNIVSSCHIHMYFLTCTLLCICSTQPERTYPWTTTQIKTSSICTTSCISTRATTQSDCGAAILIWKSLWE